jgi:hypothetical protein
VNSKLWTYDWDSFQRDDCIGKLKDKRSEIVNFDTKSHLLYHWEKHWKTLRSYPEDYLIEANLFIEKENVSHEVKR